MISSSTRASRSASRFSSPAQPQIAGKDAKRPLDDSRVVASEGSSSRTFMQRWLEPSVQSRPSYEEAGLSRHGVLETMAPLGALPKTKRAAGDGTQPVRKIILKTPAMAAARLAAEQQEAARKAAEAGDGEAPLMTISPPASPLSALAPPTTKRRPVTAKAKMEDIGEDDDYEPTVAVNGRRRSRRVSLPSKKSTPTALLPPTQPSSAKRERPRSSSGIALTITTPNRQTRSEGAERGLTAKIVDAAVGEALKHYRYPTAWALRTLYDEKHGDANFVSMIEDVFSQTADKETIEEFFRLMEQRKREGKKNNRACHYFVRPTPNSGFTPHAPIPAPYADMIHEPEELPRAKVGKRVTKKAKLSHQTDATTITDLDTAAAAMRTTHVPAFATTPRRLGADGEAGCPKSMIEVKTPGSRKRARRDSGSSDSSLSTALSLSSPELRASILNSPTAHRAAGAGAGAEEAAAAARQAGVAAGAGEAAAAASASAAAAGATLGDPRRGAVTVHSSTGAKSQTGPMPQPIKTRGKSLAASSKQSVSNSSRPKSPTLRHTSRSRPCKPLSASFVPDDARADRSPNLSTKRAEESGLPSTTVGAGRSAAAIIQPPMPEEGELASWDRRREARKVTNGVSAKESAVRGLSVEGETSTPVRSTRRTRQSLAASVTTRASQSASKRSTDQVAERHDSPLAFTLTGDGNLPGGSRSVTPTSLRPTKKQKTGLRVKSSPVKKKSGTAAGVPRPVKESSSSASGPPAKDPTADNDENCSACGGTGDVVCCDGCPRSFHFECVDMVRSDNLPDEWFCNECLIRRFPSRVPVHRGIFGNALNNLEKSIPRAFSLPKRVQTRFEGVKAGADGAYEEVATNKTVKKKAGSDESTIDFNKQREDGHAVLCHMCQKAASEIKGIIPCTVCSYYWHLDCLNPPLATPVPKTWRCPAHVDDILIEMPALAPAHRFRKVRASQAITPAISRGLKNNGHIEIEWDEESEEENRSGWNDVSSFGRTYKLSEKGLILDFIEQLRNKGAGYGHRHAESKVIPHPLSSSQLESAGPLRGSALGRKVEEMQVSLSLLGLQQKRSDGIELLTSALLSAADQNVLTLMAQSNADNIALNKLTDADRLGLRAMLTQMDAMSSRIRQVLGGAQHGTNNNEAIAIDAASAGKGRGKGPADMVAAPRTPALTEVKAEGSSPVMEMPGVSGVCRANMDTPPLVTEPTPPSTVDHAEGPMDLD
ncbi:hypothetical protein E4U23_000020 [Claviceps purpurea]|nr:hypothetical protein E4U23_000020 [Claviceps purpurea]